MRSSQLVARLQLLVLSGQSAGFDVFCAALPGSRSHPSPSRKARVLRNGAHEQAYCQAPPRRTVSRGESCANRTTIEARAQKDAE